MRQLDEHELASFISMWNAGIHCKVIAQRTGLRDSQEVSKLRQRLNLPPRYERLSPRRLERQVNILVDAETFNKLQTRLVAKGVSVSVYMRNLIKRDLGT